MPPTIKFNLYDLDSDIIDFLHKQGPLPFVASGDGPAEIGDLSWADAAQTIVLRVAPDVDLEFSEKLVYPVDNFSGADITIGTPISYAGTVGSSGKVRVKAWNGATDTPELFMGFSAGFISNGGSGYVASFGKIRGIDTSNFSDGVILYANPTGTGLTATKPETTHVVACLCMKAAHNGVILIRPTVNKITEWAEITGKPNAFTPTAHTHGSITNDGKIGTISNRAVITGTSGVITTTSREGIDTRTSFPPADHDHINKLNKLGNNYIIVTPQDSLYEQYENAINMTPNSTSLSAENRVSLILLPGEYTVMNGNNPVTNFTLSANFVDLIGTGSIKEDVGCRTAVKLLNCNLIINANDVRVCGISVQADKAIDIINSSPNLIVENCIGGDNSFGGQGKIAEGKFINCVAGIQSFGGSSGIFPDPGIGGQALGEFINCSAGNNSFGGYGGIASGVFINCTAGSWSFASGAVGATASGTFIDCVGGPQSFGGYTGIASGIFKNCVGGNHSFGGVEGSASGSFTDCIGGAYSYGGYFGIASGVFTNCKGGNNSFCGIGGQPSGTFNNCIGGDNSFGNFGGETINVNGIFNNCKAGSYSFGAGNIASGYFNNCTAEDYSFGASTIENGTASGIFSNCKAGAYSFGGSATGEFNNCTGDIGSFGGYRSGKFYYCRLTSGGFNPLSPSGISRLCVDGNNNIVNSGGLANIVVAGGNGSFENTNTALLIPFGTGLYRGGLNSVPGWTFSGGSSSTFMWMFQSPDADIYGPILGNFSLNMLRSTESFAHKVSTVVTGLVAGQNYTLTFRTAARPGGAVGSIKVLVDSTLLGEYDASIGTSYVPISYNFMAAGPTATIEFDYSLATGNYGFMLDNVEVTQ